MKSVKLGYMIAGGQKAVENVSDGWRKATISIA